MYFQTTYYRHVAGAENGLPPPWRAVRWVPPTPIFPHTRTGQAYSTPSLLQGCREGKMYLRISAAAGEIRKKMRYKKIYLFIIDSQNQKRTKAGRGTYPKPSLLIKIKDWLQIRAASAEIKIIHQYSPPSMYLKISAVSQEHPENMKYIAPLPAVGSRLCPVGSMLTLRASRWGPINSPPLSSRTRPAQSRQGTAESRQPGGARGRVSKRLQREG